MRRIRKLLQSLLGGGKPSEGARRPLRIPIVALVVSEEDRRVLTSVSSREGLDVHFVESCEEARHVAALFSAPLILLDRDWPGTEWRGAVQSLSSTAHGACIILVSGVADEYLWQELIRRGGYDLLTKPLRGENIARILKLALAYRTTSREGALTAQKS